MQERLNELHLIEWQTRHEQHNTTDTPDPSPDPDRQQLATSHKLCQFVLKCIIPALNQLCSVQSGTYPTPGSPNVQCLLSTVFQFACKRKLLSARDPLTPSWNIGPSPRTDSARWSVKRFVLWLCSICRLPSLSRTAPFLLLLLVCLTESCAWLL